MPTYEKETIVKRWFQNVFTHGDLKTLEEIAAKDMMTYSQGHDEGFVGRDNFKKWLSWYRNSFVDSEWIVHEMIEEGNKIVARYTGISTYKGGMLDIPTKDQRITETGIIIFEIENGKVIKQWCEMSDLQVIQQLGVELVTK